jgi:hypothetical protein
MLRRVISVRTDVSEELRASIIRVTRIGKLGTTLAVTSNRRTLRRNTTTTTKDIDDWTLPAINYGSIPNSCGNVVVGTTMLQAGRSRVRDPVR